MKAEAQANEAADKAERERVDKLNQADSVIFQTETFLNENGDKLPADDKPKVEAALQKLKDAHKSADLAAIDAAINEMNAIMQAASQKMYSQAGPQPGAQPGAGAGFQGQPGADQQPNDQQGKTQAEDADFEEVK